MTKVLDPSTTKPNHSLAKRVALGGVAFTAATLATLGLYGHHATTFHHDTTRLLAEIATAKGIEVSLRDAQGTLIHGMLLPKATASPNNIAFDGRISYELTGSQYNFTLLNDRAYLTVEDMTTGKLTRSGCIHPENVPPIATLTDALHNARVIDAVAGKNVTCASGKMIEFDFAGEPYVMCKSAESADSPRTVSVHGDDLQASLKLLSDNSQGIPSLASLAPPVGLDLSKCDAITTATGDESLVPSRSARLLQRTQDAWTVATGGRRLGKTASGECGCTDGKKKQCLFVHGFGQSPAGATTDTFKYFGEIEKQLPCCESIKFMHLETNDEPWYSPTLTQQVCDTAVAMTQAKDKMAIENLQLIAHSMGNLVVSAAIMDGKCALDKKSSKWVSLAGPIYGTKLSTAMLSAMDGLSNKTREAWCHNDPNTKLDDPIFSLLNSNHLCSSLKSLRSIAAKGSAKSMAALDALFVAAGQVFKDHVGANMCGVSATGLLTADSAKKVLEAIISGHPSIENDGQVHIDSCRGPLPVSQYSKSWHGGAFYKASLNHVDIAMRNGDGWWGDDRKPIKWLQCQF